MALRIEARYPQLDNAIHAVRGGHAGDLVEGMHALHREHHAALRDQVRHDLPPFSRP